MGVIVQCRCGNYVTIASERGMTQGQCPQCGQTVLLPAMGPGSSPMMGGGAIAIPTMVPERLRVADKPPVYLTIRADRVNLTASFDTSPVLSAFVEGFAKKLRKQFNVQLAPAPQPGAPGAVVNVVTMDEGNRMLRYFLLFAGHTILEIDGEVIAASGQKLPFKHKARGMMGLFGGDSLGMLKMGGMSLGKKVAKQVASMG